MVDRSGSRSSDPWTRSSLGVHALRVLTTNLTPLVLRPEVGSPQPGPSGTSSLTLGSANSTAFSWIASTIALEP